MHLLPRSRRGTWLLAGAAWCAACAGLWWALPVVPLCSWDVPPLDHYSWDFLESLTIVYGRREKDTIALVTAQPAPALSGPVDFARTFKFDYFTGPLRVFDLKNGHELKRYFGTEDRFETVTASPNGRWIACVGYWDDEHPIRLIDAEGQHVFDLPHTGKITSCARPLAFTPDNRFLVYESTRHAESKLVVWDLANSCTARTIPDAKPPIGFSPEGSCVAFVTATSSDALIRVAEWTTLQEIGSLPVGDTPVFDISLSTAGRHTAAFLGSKEQAEEFLEYKRFLHCWDTKDQRILLHLQCQQATPISPDGRTVAIREEQDRISAFDLEAGCARWTRTIDGNSIEAVLANEPALRSCGKVVFSESVITAWDRFGSWIVQQGREWPYSWGMSRISEVVDVESGQPIMKVNSYLGRTEWSSDGKSFIAVTPRGKSTPARVQIWDFPPRKPRTWFAASAAILALTIALLAWRRNRTLRAA
jgi:WD40 repeat protein